jgi:Ion transport protein
MCKQRNAAYLDAVPTSLLGPQAKGLRTLFQTLVFSLPALVNVGSVFFLFMFIFAVMGMSLFGQVRFDGTINRHVNFATFPNALLLLLRMSTGESWNGIMHACLLQTECRRVRSPFTNADGHYIESTDTSGAWYDASDSRLSGAPAGAIDDQCGPWAGIGILYFVVFVILCAFLLLNLVIAVILDNFQSSTNNEELEVSQSSLLNYARVWGQLDKKCTMFIPTARLSKLIEMLDHPLGVAGLMHPQLEVQNIIMSVDIPNRMYKGSPHVHFMEVLHALAGRVAGVQLPTDEAEKMHACFTGMLPIHEREYPKYSAAHYHAALHVQAAVRGFLARYKMQVQQQEIAAASPAVGGQA